MVQGVITWEKAAHANELLDDIRTAHQAGKRKKAAYLQQRYLQSFDARLMATRTAFDAMRPMYRPPENTLAGIAESLNAWRGTDERVGVSFKEKVNDPNQYRPILNFQIRNRALQYLARAALEPRADLDPRQFGCRGGRDAAVSVVKEGLLNGYNHVFECDIHECYPSINEETLSQLLPLPKEVTDKTILARGLNLYPTMYQGTLTLEELEELNALDWTPSDQNFLNANQPIPNLHNLPFGPDDGWQLIPELAKDIAAVRRGLPQGSAVSPLVVEIMLAPVIAHLPDSVVAANYADNILVAAKTPEEAASMRKSLWSALSGHPAGPLNPNAPKIYKPGQTVEFLGYVFELAGHHCLVKPSPLNFQKFTHRFAREKHRAAKTQNKAIRYRRIASLRHYIVSWSSAFHLWAGAAQHRDTCLGELNKLAKYPRAVQLTAKRP